MADRPYTFKTLDQSLWEQMSLFWSRTGIKPDPEPGGVLRTLFEAVGFEVEDLSFRFDQALDQAIPLAVFEAFGFEPLEALPASAPVTFTRAAGYPDPLTIPEGFRVSRADGFEYELTSDATIPGGNTEVTVSVVAVNAGAAGNTPANTITQPSSSIPTLIDVTNDQPAIGGQDAEPLEDQKRRFAGFIAMVHRATRAALAAAALTVQTGAGERAREVLILDNVYASHLVPGLIEVWVDDGFASASSSLVDDIHSIVEAYRAAGAVHSTHAVTPHNVTIEYTLDGDPDFLEMCDEAARTYIRELRIGQKVSRENLITAITNAAAGEREIDLIQPSADVMISQTARAVLTSLVSSVV